MFDFSPLICLLFSFCKWQIGKDTQFYSLLETTSVTQVRLLRYKSAFKNAKGVEYVCRDLKKMTEYFACM